MLNQQFSIKISRERDRSFITKDKAYQVLGMTGEAHNAMFIIVNDKNMIDFINPHECEFISFESTATTSLDVTNLEKRISTLEHKFNEQSRTK